MEEHPQMFSTYTAKPIPPNVCVLNHLEHMLSKTTFFFNEGKKQLQLQEIQYPSSGFQQNSHYAAFRQLKKKSGIVTHIFNLRLRRQAGGSFTEPVPELPGIHGETLS